ncbi:sensor histidine kinase [Streptococcus phocae subsp. phocae]
MKGDMMEERFKKRLQDDISHHFSNQSLILSVLLIGLFVIFSLAPQHIGLYHDLKRAENSYHELREKNETLLAELNANSLTRFITKELSPADLSKHYYHLRNTTQSQSELLVFAPDSHLLFASNQHLGNFFDQSVYVSELIKKAKSSQNSLVKLVMDNDETHYLALMKPILVNGHIKGYSLVLVNGKDFLQPSDNIDSDVIIADHFDNTFAFTSRDFISSSLNKVVSRDLTHYFIFKNNKTFIVRTRQLSSSIVMYLYRPLVPVRLIVLFSLLSSLLILVMLNRQSKSLATKIASKNSAAINQMVLDMSAISRQEKTSIALDSQDEFQYLSDQINHMLSRLRELHHKTLELEKQKLVFEKRMLEAQFNPHFLYNTLETILITSHYNANITEKIVIQLTKLLRYSLSNTQEAVALKDDLAVIESYLLINKVRFEELRYEIDIEESLNELKVPKLCLLPLIENAIKYGLQYRHDVFIQLRIYQDHGDIYFTVADNGPGINLERQNEIRALLASEDSYHGLVNSYRRLKYQFSEVDLSFQKDDETFLLTYKVKE